MDNLQSVLFVDIQTVTQYPSYKDMPKKWQALWEDIARGVNITIASAEDEEDSEEDYEDSQEDQENLKKIPEEALMAVYNSKGAFYARFGKIVCISCSRIIIEGSHRKMEVTSFQGDDEKDILQRWANMVEEWLQAGGEYLCADNSKYSVYSFLCQRLIVQGIKLPYILNSTICRDVLQHQLDIGKMWDFNEDQNYETLSNIAITLDILTATDNMNNDTIRKAYWIDKNPTIIIYRSRKDVITLTQVFLRLQSQPVIQAQAISIS